MNGEGWTLIVGIGSDFGEDRLGPIVVERLSRRLLICDVCRLRSPIDLLDHLANVARLHIVDACCGVGPPGTIARRDWPAADLAAVRFSGTHDFGLVATLQLADRLRMLPPQVTIWAVAVSDDAQLVAMAPLSSAVSSAAEVLVANIAAEVNGCHAMDEEPIHHA